MGLLYLLLLHPRGTVGSFRPMAYRELPDSRTNKKNSKLHERSHKTEGIPSTWGVTKSTSEIRWVDMRVEILTGDAKA